MSRAVTLYEKIWNAHVVDRWADGTCLVLVDRQILYEATSREAFAGLRQTGREVRRPGASLAMADHTVDTRVPDGLPVRSSRLVDELRDNCAAAGIPYLERDDPGTASSTWSAPSRVTPSPAC
jgi:3-isopropylmalate/(R)-2-methylmalate dehydratase large subunit